MFETKRVIIDAGHGGERDPGAVFEGRQEKDDALRLALAVGRILEENGVEVLYTRINDVYDSPLEKAQIANESGADYLISIHRNAMPIPGTASGIMSLVYQYGGVAELLGRNINRELARLGFADLGVIERPGLAILRRSEMPAVLVEAGFIDNPQDNALFDAMFPEIAQAIADGIMETLDAAAGDTAGGSSGEGDASEDSGNSSQDPGAPRPLYRVQVGAFYNLQNAVALEQELKRMGYNTWIVTV